MTKTDIADLTCKQKHIVSNTEATITYHRFL